MKPNTITIDRDTEMLLPHNLQDWLPENDLARFVVECIEEMRLMNVKLNWRGSGSKQYPPRTMLALLVYCYSQGVFSSRKIEKASYRDIAVRYICGGDHHPDHDTICDFRNKNKPLLEECFINVLQLAKEMGIMQVGSIALDGTKIKANASKHKAVSYKHAGDTIEKLEKEVTELIQAAEKADQADTEDDLSIPEEFSNRQQRIEKLKEARKNLEKRAKEEAVKKQQKQINEGKKPRKKISDIKPEDKKQINFTDEESRIMKAGNGKHFEQAYNAQASVTTDGSSLVVGKYVTNKENDKQEISNGVDSVPEEIGQAEKVAVDNGYMNQEQIIDLENPDESTGRKPTRVYVSQGKIKHGKTLALLRQEKNADTEKDEKVNKTQFDKIMHDRLSSREGRDFYNRRKVTVEPLFGFIKREMGFRQFLLRGLEKVNIEWDLVTLAYNFRRIHALQQA